MNITTFERRRAAVIDTCRSKRYEVRAQPWQNVSDSTVAQKRHGYWRPLHKKGLEQSSKYAEVALQTW